MATCLKKGPMPLATMCMGMGPTLSEVQLKYNVMNSKLALWENLNQHQSHLLHFSVTNYNFNHRWCWCQYYKITTETENRVTSLIKNNKIWSLGFNYIKHH